MTLKIDKYVFWLQVTIHNVMLVQMLKSKNYLGNYDSSIVFIKLFVVAQMVEELTCWAKL